jgi:hypothetical protein
MCKLKVLDRRVALAGLLSRVELNILNDLLITELDAELEYECGTEIGKYLLTCQELEVITRAEEPEIITYADITGEDHGESGIVRLTYQNMDFTLSHEWLFSVTDFNKPAYIYTSLVSGHNIYLLLTPEDVDAIFTNEDKIWEGKDR